MDVILSFIKQWIPAWVMRRLIGPYHFVLAYLGALRFGFPSRDLVVIGVTGTKGKSSTTEILNTILEHAGISTALQNTIRFKIGGASEPNLFKMTMRGRFFMQRFFRRAKRAGCTHAIVELSSEGVLQHRHRFIELDALILTNIAREHIEAHGSFERYVAAKLALGFSLLGSPKQNKLLILNGDDECLAPFRTLPIKKAYFSMEDVVPYQADDRGGSFTFQGTLIRSPLPGLFNLKNVHAAVLCAEHLGIATQTIQDALASFSHIPGRAERIEEGQGFPVVVDYAHTPESLLAIYDAYKNYTLVCVLGNTGGGRDTWKRPKMARIAEKHCADVILTNEDPYDEDPRVIVEAMARGMKEKRPEIIMDRRKAIQTALTKARALRGAQSDAGVAVIITGKGTDPYIMGAGGKKTPWGDARVTREELRALNK